ncbi:glycosyltransferase [Porphyrobacter sp. SLTP]|uniref:glycosyltransferase n=1 Tax=Porphyrobacter sp. SLTP TaxID=2683266 RepID=UPI001412CF25|nr:glycosyltransferase [Porphyrobacter sp. SLTP]NBB24655.1 glycosyltransferase [Porphyrobacter sp. SLTP]
MTRPVVVCVPARNEAKRLPLLLEALAHQTLSAPINVALCVNNSTDGSAEAAEEAVAKADGRLRLNLLTCEFPPERAHAGSARRAAMDLGAGWLNEDDALLVSTDADCRPPADWLEANLASAGPMRIVGGRVELDEREADTWPLLFDLRSRFDDYWSKVREIEDAVDPVPWDLPPRHGDHTGASLALTAGLYDAAGGVPLTSSGEDRALVAAALAVGGELIHPQAVWTRTSARPAGRADGGMAEEMRRWLAAGSDGVDPKVPAFNHWQSRALWRRAMRRALGPGELMLAEAKLPPMPNEMSLPKRLRASSA